jgi:hypothetical protein
MNERTLLSSTMPILSTSNNVDQLATLAHAGDDSGTSPLQPPTGGVGGGDRSPQAFFSKVGKSPYDGKDNSNALKASGFRVMDDMAIQGMGQSRAGASLGSGLAGSTTNGGGNGGSTRSADTNTLTSPVKTGKKKKLATKGSSSAKGRGN